MLVGGRGLAAQEVVASETIVSESQTIALGVRVDWGEGTLTLKNGEQYRFTLQGLEVGGVGLSQVCAEGEVYNLAASLRAPMTHNHRSFSGRLENTRVL